jgi:hypothetical protein
VIVGSPLEMSMLVILIVQLLLLLKIFLGYNCLIVLLLTYFSSCTSAETFYVGRRKIFSMDIKPRNMTGLIFALVDQKSPETGDFVVLELNDGSVSSLENYIS